jgi:hypothetical protein
MIRSGAERLKLGKTLDTSIARMASNPAEYISGKWRIAAAKSRAHHHDVLVASKPLSPFVSAAAISSVPLAMSVSQLPDAFVNS